MPLKRKQGGQVVGFDTGVTRGWGWLFGNGAQVWLMQNYKLLVKVPARLHRNSTTSTPKLPRCQKLIAYPRAITAAIQRQLEPRDIKKKTLLVACMMAVPHQNTAPAQSEYAGDEVSAIVLDPGYSTTRAGFAGEDTPKSIVPTYYGVLESADSGARHLFGDNAIHNPLANFEIKHPMSNDGIVEDWDVAQKLWEYSITSRLTGAKATQPSKNGLNDPSNGDGDVDMESTEDTERPIEDSPLLMTEPGWNSAKAREKTIEIAIEDWGCPAFYMQKTGVLAAFASGRATALVIDVGASMTSVTPVIDGMVLKKGVQRAPIGGNFVSQQIRLALAQAQPPAPLTPHFMVASKTPVDAGAAAQATYRKFDTPPTASFRRFQEERVLTEFKESVVQVWAGPGRLSNGQNEELAKTHPGRPFEMPDGWNQVFGLERYKVVEGLFDAKAALTDADTPKPRDDQTIPALINAALNAADVDYRPPLLSNIVVTGGSSLLWQFNDRLTQEIQTMFPAPRFRIQAAGNTVERKYGAWIGGSVLASLGSFHQNWISKKEYEEHGAAIVEKRCK